ncbi:ABC transporter ATP-binding protein [Parablautia sp. Marseille-Q6255]|uniref:ABC transporter ATP-binding protein n=1 Tax=Parablautia sp. Marseille-Q6255 TaxID=3039593 RepID=UPI0024BD113B|nr:ABC transporter ATP-binding protein [Parablautia sp. Marseille-Q6255]
MYLLSAVEKAAALRYDDWYYYVTVMKTGGRKGDCVKEYTRFKKVAQKIYDLLERRQKQAFAGILLIMAASAALTQFTPKAIGWLTDDILRRSGIVFWDILPVLAVILAVNVLNELLKIGRRLMVEDVATKTEKKARGLVILSLLRAPLSFFRENMTGNIHGRLNRCLDGTVKLEKLVFMDLAPAVFNSIAAILVIVTTLPVVLALPMLLVVPIGMAVVFRQISTQRGIRVELLETKAAMDGSVVELLNGIEVIRITDSVVLEGERFDRKSELLRKKEMRHHVQMAKYDCLKFMNEAVFTVLMIGISVWLATKNRISVGDVLTSYLCFTQLLRPLEELHRILDELSESMVLAEDFFSLAEIPCDFSYECPQLPAEHHTIESHGAIEIRNLHFSYDKNKLVLHNTDLSIQRGMFLGIAGPSGCGKSSLIKAICRLEDYEGEIWINGKNLRLFSRQELSDLIALVPQSPFLVAGTIYDNICYGLKVRPERKEAELAVRKACLSEFVDSLPDRLDTVIAEGGGNLSGGQRQRIALARIFLRKPEILILDEATSALDNTSERLIQREIEQLMKENGMTVISIAHRLTTLKNADRIIVVDNGAIAQAGTYEELLRQEGMFQDMYYGKLLQQ